MLSNEIINNILGIKEGYEMPEKLTDIMLSEQKEIILSKFMDNESDLSFDWFTNYFQEEHGDRDKLKQDYTPDCVCKILNGLESGSIIADICAGTGGLTINAWNNNKDAFFYCEEISKRAVPLLLFNLAIRNVNGVVVNGDSLTGKTERIYTLKRGVKFSQISQQSVEVKPDCDLVISNPPYSLSWKPQRDARFDGYELPPASKADYAFVLHGLKKTKSGKELLILPHGVLFRGQAEGKIRQRLVENNLIDTIIGLPENLFLNTAIPVCIIVLNKSKKDKNILFIDASKDFEKRGKQNKMSAEQIQRVVDTYKKRNTETKYSYIASFEEIANNDFNLNIPRYVDTFEKEPVPPIDETITDLLKCKAEARETEKAFVTMLKQLENRGSDAAQYNAAVGALIETLESEPPEIDCDIDINALDAISAGSKITKKLTEVAKIERAVKGKIYEAGATLIELSATSGAYRYHEKAGEIEPRYAVVIPNNCINGRYLYESIGFSFPKWYSRYKTTMNIQFEALDHFEVIIHDDKSTQEKIVAILENQSRQIEEAEKELEKWEDIKKYYLDGMFPEPPKQQNAKSQKQTEKVEKLGQVSMWDEEYKKN